MIDVTPAAGMWCSGRRRSLASRKIAALLCCIAVVFLSTGRSSAAPPPAAAQAVFVVSNSGSAHINEYTTNGALVRTLSGGPASSSYRGLAFGADGFLYVTNTLGCDSTGCGNELEKYDPNTGAYLGTIGFFSAPATSSNGLTLGPDGDLYVTTNGLGLYKIDPTANTAVSTTTADCCTYGVAFLDDGTPLAIDSSQNAVKNDLTGAAFNSGFFTSAQAIAFGPDGRLYVLEYHDIQTVPSTGGASTLLTASNALGLGFFETFDSSGNIWTTDQNYGVREFSSVTGQQLGGFANNLASEFAGIAVGTINGNVWAWGDNAGGQLGNGSTVNSSTPVLVNNLSGLTAISAGKDASGTHSLALKSDGTVWAWGYNGSGQLGNGTTTDSYTPVQVSNLTGVVAIAAGVDHSLALKSDGTVWAWGFNFYGQLGNGTTTDSSTPVQVSSLAGVIAIGAGSDHSLAVKSDGTVWAWGENYAGQLGNGTTTNGSTSTPVQVMATAGVAFSGAIAVAGGNVHSMALKSDGTVWTWGDNTYDELGNGSSAPGSTTPVQVSGLAGVTSISTTYLHNLALKNDGTLWTWGENDYGQLGNGMTTNSNIPVQVLDGSGAALSSVIAIAAGSNHSLAVESDGTLWTWGHNADGELGNGTTTQSSVPVQVSSLTDVAAIAGGANYSLAIQGQANGAATHFSVSAPSTATAGASFNFTVTALDASGHVATSYTGTAAFSSSDPSAVFPANYTFTASDSGTHTFSATLDSSGSQTITATDATTATITGTSGAITVTAAAATHFTVTAPASATAGTSFSVTVTPQDAYNNTVTGYTGTVHFTSTDTQAVLPSDYTFTAADQGMHVFTAVTLNTAGSQTITATDTATAIVGTSNPITVSAGLATHFFVNTPTAATQGIPFSFSVTAVTAANAAATNYTGTVHFTSTDPQAVLPLDYTFTAADQGFHSFSGTVNTPPNQKITATDTANSSITGTSSPVLVTVSPAATHLALAAPASVTAGTAFSVTVTALNAANQTATSYTGTVHFTSTDPQAGLPTDYTFTASDKGMHVFNAVTLNTSGSQTITAADVTNSAINGNSGPITVASPPPPVVQVIDSETVTVSDTESFPDVFDAETIHVTDGAFVTPLIAVTAPVAEFSAGGLGFGGQSGNQTITVSDIGEAPVTLSSVSISGGQQFAIAQITCSSGAISFSTILPSGGVCILTINYAASSTPANDNASLVFNDNAALSNLLSAPSGSSYTQSVPLSGGGTNVAPPPPPPATVPVLDNETITVNDTESFPDVFDSEPIKVTDQVSVGTLQSIAVTPANSTIANGATEKLTATGNFSDGSTQNLTGAVVWSSSNSAVATMNGNTATAVGLGRSTITATLGSTAGSTTLTVRPPILIISAKFSSIALNADGSYTVTISVTNTGDITANNIAPVVGILGGGLLSSSTAAVNVAPGATATLTAVFPSSAGKPGSTQPLFVLGLATGTAPNGTPAPPALWSLPGRITLP